jgi:hypothetical protein
MCGQMCVCVSVCACRRIRVRGEEIYGSQEYMEVKRCVSRCVCVCVCVWNCARVRRSILEFACPKGWASATDGRTHG